MGERHMASLEEIEAAKRQLDEAHEDLMRYIEGGVMDSRLQRHLAARLKLAIEKYMDVVTQK
jgi:hypothetical protein